MTCYALGENEHGVRRVFVRLSSADEYIGEIDRGVNGNGETVPVFIPHKHAVLTAPVLESILNMMKWL